MARHVRPGRLAPPPARDEAWAAVLLVASGRVARVLVTNVPGARRAVERLRSSALGVGVVVELWEPAGSRAPAILVRPAPLVLAGGVSGPAGTGRRR